MLVHSDSSWSGREGEKSSEKSLHARPTCTAYNRSSGNRCRKPICAHTTRIHRIARDFDLHARVAMLWMFT